MQLCSASRLRHVMACEMVSKLSAQACASEHACAPDLVTQHPFVADTTAYR